MMCLLLDTLREYMQGWLLKLSHGSLATVTETVQGHF